MTKTVTARPAGQPPAGQPPAGIRVTAIALLAEAVGMLIATGYSAAATISGKSYQTASGIALTLIAFGVAVGLGYVSRSLYQLKLWSRTPVLLAQLAGIGVALYLLDGHRADWGIPVLVLSVAALIALFTPDSFKALNR